MADKEEKMMVDGDDDDEYEEYDEYSDEEALAAAEAADAGEDGEDGDEAAAAAGPKEAYIPGAKMEEDEELVCDPSAYVVQAEFSMDWPCLSFDIIRDALGDVRTSFPMTAYIVAGTQAAQSSENKLAVMKVSNLHKTKAPSGDDSESESDESSDSEDEEEEGGARSKRPQMVHRSVKHRGGVNRVRAARGVPGRHIVSSWSDTGKVHVWDLAAHVRALEQPPSAKVKLGGAASKPLFTFEGHESEGWAMDWSPVAALRLATGDNMANVHVLDPVGGGSTWVSAGSSAAHQSSVEDIQWSPKEANVFASCSSDRSLRVWDTRKGCRAVFALADAHDTDVNCISWNPLEQHLLASGGDDGMLKIFDLRMFPGLKKGKAVQPIATFKWHSAPITSVEWHPTDPSVVAVSGADDQVSIWDMSVEPDEEADTAGAQELQGVPPQLLFIHQGQRNIKELHWHPQLPGVMVTTAESNFNLFKSIVS